MLNKYFCPVSHLGKILGPLSSFQGQILSVFTPKNRLGSSSHSISPNYILLDEENREKSICLTAIRFQNSSSVRVWKKNTSFCWEFFSSRQSFTRAFSIQGEKFRHKVSVEECLEWGRRSMAISPVSKFVK